MFKAYVQQISSFILKHLYVGSEFHPARGQVRGVASGSFSDLILHLGGEGRFSCEVQSFQVHYNVWI